MTATTLSTALAPVQPAFTDAERLAPAGYRGLTREASTSSPAGAGPGPCRCPRSAAQASRRSPGNWTPAAGPAPPLPAGCAPSPASAGTPPGRTARPPA